MLPDDAVIVIAWPADAEVPTVAGQCETNGAGEIVATYEKWQLEEALWAHRGARAARHAADNYEQAGLFAAEPAPVGKGPYDD